MAERKIRGRHPELGSIHVVDSAEFVSLAAARDVIRRANERIAELERELEVSREARRCVERQRDELDAENKQLRGEEVGRG